MKRMHCRLPYLFLLAIALIFAACSKDGSAGPAGPAGPAGAAGPGGAAGPKGDPGTANVIYSGWLDVTFDTLKNETSGAVEGFGATIDAPKLTNELLGNGTVNLYLNLSTAAAPAIVAIPYVEPQVYINFVAHAGAIEVTSNIDLSTGLNQSNVKVYQFRYALVPGGTAARSSSAVDWKDYKSVQKYLGLKD